MYTINITRETSKGYHTTIERAETMAELVEKYLAAKDDPSVVSICDFPFWLIWEAKQATHKS